MIKKNNPCILLVKYIKSKRIMMALTTLLLILNAVLIKAAPDVTNSREVALQTVTITGTVTDQEKNPLVGVYVVIENTKVVAITDANGKYSIEVPDQNASLVFSFIGYLSETVAVAGKSVIDVSLMADVTNLEEVVVVGYGSVRKSDVTGSVSSVTNKSLQEVPVANLSQGLQGRAAGVDVSQTSSRPGTAPYLRIRGNRSLTGENGPLLVVDGIPFAGNINDLNPDDITSVDILKDASATAIYGSRGSNGVIMITTKRGTIGKPTVSLNSYYGITQAVGEYDVMNAREFYELRKYAGYLGGVMEAEEDYAYNNNISTDWQDLMYENGYSTNTDLTISGGTESTQYSFGGGYFKQTTVLPGQAFERYSLRATIDQSVGKRFKFGINTLNTLNYTDGDSVDPMYNILTLSPLWPAYNDDGTIRTQPDPKEDSYNVLFLKDKNNWKEQHRVFRSFNTFYGEVEILKGLKYRMNVGLDYRQENYGNYYGSNTPMRNGNASTATLSNREKTGYTWENLLIYDRVFADKHHVNFTGLYSCEESEEVYSGIDAQDVAADYMQYYNLSTANSVTLKNGTEARLAMMSVMGRINYGYDNRYLLTLSYRGDGASQLAEGHKWNWYPALALAWNISNESFFENVNAVSNLKIRFGYGKASNAAVPAYSTLGGLTKYPYNFGTNNYYGYYVSTGLNYTLGWENTTTTNLGLDFGLLRNRITASIDLYQATTTDILVSKPLPQTSGVQSRMVNSCETKNKGIEITLGATVIQSAKGFNWNIDLNYYVNREEIVKLDEPGKTEDIDNGWFVGYPMDVIYDYVKEGIWQLGDSAEAASYNGGFLPGDIRLRDLSGPDGVPDTSISAVYDRKVIGTYEPKWSGGITNRFAFKGIDLSIVTVAKMGQKIVATYYQDQSYLNMLQGRRNGMNVDYWTIDNPTNAFPEPDAADDRPNYGSTLGYFDGSFIKVRSINLGYTLPSKWFTKIGISTMRIYFTAQNPFILYSPFVKDGYGLDPETTAAAKSNTVYDRQNNNISTGALIVRANTPPTRQYIFGINLKF